MGPCLACRAFGAIGGQHLLQPLMSRRSALTLAINSREPKGLLK